MELANCDPGDLPEREDREQMGFVEEPSFRCIECGEIVSESQRLEMQNSSGDLIYKCPCCRGRLEAG
jgi:predicted SprT family Zn-dependent metalloprotease